MSTVTSQIRSIITDLHTLLEARAGLAGVTVFRYAPSPRALEGLREWIVLATRAPRTEDYPMLSPTIKDENFSLHGVVYVEKPGAGDDVADEAQARAEVLLAEIAAQLITDLSLGRTDTTVKLVGAEHTYGADDRGRQHSLAFELECWARLIST